MKRVVIFRQIIEKISELNYYIQENELKEENVSMALKQKKALLQILKYAISEKYKWTSNQSKNKILEFIKNGCDYEATRKVLNAKSKNSIEVSISNLSKKFEMLIGADTVSMILEGRIEEGLINVRSGIGVTDLSTYFPSNIVQRFNQETGANVYHSFKECLMEVELLTSLSKANVDRVIGEYDLTKINFILSILLNNNMEFSAEKRMLDNLLRGKFKDRGNLKAQVEAGLEILDEENEIFKN